MGDANLIRRTVDDLRAERAEHLAVMGITLDEYRAATLNVCCVDCARPEWSERWERWAEVDDCDFLLQEGRHG